MNDVLKAIEKRSSARAYAADMLTAEELQAIINAGLQAPTATNRQEIRFAVAKQGNPVLQEIEDEKNRQNNAAPKANFYYDAPVVVFLYGESAFHWSEVDAGIAVQSMALAAESLGLGSLIIGCVRNALHGEKAAEFNEKLQMPEGFDFKIAIALGHKTDAKVPHTYTEEAQVKYLG